jgi:L-cystine uptake protein TcyP (sodium:dicarboxylate symporter family)
MDTVTHVFFNMIKMIIAPLIFATLVSGVAGAAQSAGVGKLFGRSILWFLCASAIVEAFGFLTAHVLNVGQGAASTTRPWRRKRLPLLPRNQQKSSDDSTRVARLRKPGGATQLPQPPHARFVRMTRTN